MEAAAKAPAASTATKLTQAGISTIHRRDPARSHLTRCSKVVSSAASAATKTAARIDALESDRSIQAWIENRISRASNAGPGTMVKVCAGFSRSVFDEGVGSVDRSSLIGALTRVSMAEF